MSPHARFLSAAAAAAAALTLSACSPEGGSEEEFRQLLVENGLPGEELRITAPDSQGFWWATYDVSGDCQLQFKWNGAGPVVLYGAQADGYLREAPEETHVEDFGVDDVQRACEGKF
ncbi:hypothetical protein A6A08_04305 [Nocardiopsis sp. TSRI0078]|uniref:hypothetical protein n=1 Tax=unclassified Nocardiopsis TaxID=2649073 RepID=UPI00093B71EB|nr:hypothetical protein [Nocardiopsis sp. TSRI0078]OKI18851.1 hypothetical protein A6A08_04305 [Nocardiopsis sp. TSRI0078]